MTPISSKAMLNNKHRKPRLWQSLEMVVGMEMRSVVAVVMAVVVVVMVEVTVWPVLPGQVRTKCGHGGEELSIWGKLLVSGLTVPGLRCRGFWLRTSFGNGMYSRKTKPS